jgi:FkbM family methyltransferase
VPLLQRPGSSCLITFWKGVYSSDKDTAINVASVTRPYRYLGDRMALINLRDGTPFVVDTQSLDISLSLITHGFWEDWIEPHVVGALQPGMTFVDIGANIGYYTVLGAKAVGAAGQVIAFEPNPRAYQILTTNLFINGTRAVAHQMALGSRVSEATLFVNQEESGGAHVSNDPNSRALSLNYKTIPIKVTRLDDVIQRSVNIDVIKIDVEGYEPDVLLGAQKTIERLPNVRLAIELAPDAWAGQGHDPAMVLRMLTSMGFRLSLIKPGFVEELTVEELLNQSRSLSYVTCFLAVRG